MSATFFLVYLPFVLFATVVGAMSMQGVHAGVALSYWLGKKRAPVEPKEIEDRALRWMTEVYGSGIPIDLIRRLFLILGIFGCVSLFTILVVEGWRGLHGEVEPMGLAFTVWYFLSMLFLFVPLGWLQFRWRKPIARRQRAATQRIFGVGDGLRQAMEVLRQRYPEADNGVSLWSFPMSRAGILGRFQGAPFWFLLSSLVALFFGAQTVLAFVSGAACLAAFLVLPINFFGLLAAYGQWRIPEDEKRMVFPIAVFLDNARRG